MRRFVVVLLLAVCGSWTFAPKAMALAAFKREFQNLYITPKTDKEFAKVVKSNRTGCFVCHQGKNRKNHNAYGIHLVDLLDKTDAKNTPENKKKIIDALRKVEAMHTDPNDEKSPTYGDLIRENKLPGGELKDLMKEPAGDAEEPPAPGEVEPNPGAGP